MKQEKNWNLALRFSSPQNLSSSDKIINIKATERVVLVCIGIKKPV